MKHDALVFDLDGTLWNACGSVANGWNFGLKELNISRTVTADHIASVCGLPTPDCVRKLFPEVTEAALENTMNVLGKYEKASLLKQGGTLYPNVLEGLTLLKNNYRLFLVSNCEEWYLDCFFETHKVSYLFEDWECYGRTQKPKSDNLKLLASRNNLKNPLYIGDTEGDYRAAQMAGYDFAFVSYGFGKVQAPNTYSHFSELVEKFC